MMICPAMIKGDGHEGEGSTYLFNIFTYSIFIVEIIEQNFLCILDSKRRIFANKENFSKENSLQIKGCKECKEKYW